MAPEMTKEEIRDGQLIAAASERVLHLLENGERGGKLNDDDLVKAASEVVLNSCPGEDPERVRALVEANIYRDTHNESLAQYRKYFGEHGIQTGEAHDNYRTVEGLFKKEKKWTRKMKGFRLRDFLAKSYDIAERIDRLTPGLDLEIDDPELQRWTGSVERTIFGGEFKAVYVEMLNPRAHKEDLIYRGNIIISSPLFTANLETLEVDPFPLISALSLGNRAIYGIGLKFEAKDSHSYTRENVELLREMVRDIRQLKI